MAASPPPPPPSSSKLFSQSPFDRTKFSIIVYISPHFICLSSIDAITGVCTIFACFCEAFVAVVGIFLRFFSILCSDSQFSCSLVIFCISTKYCANAASLLVLDKQKEISIFSGRRVGLIILRAHPAHIYPLNGVNNRRIQMAMR